MNDEARRAVTFGDALRFHQLPARIVGNASIEPLACRDQPVECAHQFLGRGGCVERVELEQINVVGAEPPQCLFDRADQSSARRAPVLRAVTHRQTGFGRDQHLIAPSFDRRARGDGNRQSSKSERRFGSSFAEIRGRRQRCASEKPCGAYHHDALDLTSQHICAVFRQAVHFDQEAQAVPLAFV